jgi:acetoin utilization deacetylase AcuC-like enzyme
MHLTAAGYELITRELRAVADETAAGRIVHLLEGGYDLGALTEGVGTVLRVLTGDRSESGADGAPAGDMEAAAPAARAVADAVIRSHAEYWPLTE